MEITAILLVLISAFMHASWNFLGKRNRPSAASFTVIAALGSVCVAPFLLLLIDGMRVITAETTLLLTISCFFQALYFYSLGQGYSRGDMSVIYPITRSLPVLLVAIIVTLFGQMTALQIGDWVAFALIIAGCLLLPFESFASLSLNRYFNTSTLFALLAAIGTAGYTIVDNSALQILRESWNVTGVNYKAAFLYLILQAIGTTVFMVLATAPFKQQRDEIKHLLNNQFRSLLLTGVVMFLTYGIVLSAMAFTENVSYIVALRQASIPIGVLMGVFLLKETASLPKWSGVILLVSGLVWVSL